MCIFSYTVMYKLVLKVLLHFEKGFFAVWGLNLSPKQGGIPDNFPTLFIISVALYPVGSLVHVQVWLLQKPFAPQLNPQMSSLQAKFAPDKGWMMMKSSPASVSHPGMLPTEVRLQHLKRCTLFTQVEFFEDTAGSTTRLSHIHNCPGAALTDIVSLITAADKTHFTQSMSDSHQWECLLGGTVYEERVLSNKQVEFTHINESWTV